MSAQLDILRSRLRAYADPAKARLLAGFFKTGPGQYGEGDVFLGIMVPQTRAVVREFRDLPLSDIAEFLASEYHEERLCALLLLVQRFGRGDQAERKRIYRFYLDHTARINNWDLVDLSAPNIVGEYLAEATASGTVLVRLAHSRDLWRRRIAVLATFAFIKRGRHVPTFNIAHILLEDRHDLIHKAVGWALREVGKQIGQDVEEEFLKKYYRRMPRTMLRYAVERFPRRLYDAYLDGRI